MKKIIKISEADNMSPIINDILNSLNNNDSYIIKFEKKTYHFYEDGCYTGIFSVSNNCSGTKNVAFALINKNNIEIDGNGAEFVFHGRIYPFIMQDSKNIVIHDISIDYSNPVCAWGTILSSNEKYFDLYINENIDYEVNNGHIIFRGENHCFSSEDGKLLAGEFDLNRGRSADDAWLFYLKIGTARYEIDNPAVRIMETDAYEIDDRTVRFSFTEESIKEKFKQGNGLILHYETRDYGMFFAERTEDIHIKNVNIYRGVGMGIIAQRSKDIYVDNIKIMPKEDRGDLISITADCIHAVNCSGNISITNSLFDRSLDDALNIHGIYSVVSEVLSEHEFTVKLMHEDQYHVKYYYKGDELTVIDNNDLGILRNVTIEQADFFDNEEKIIRIKAKEKIDDFIKSGVLIENPQNMPEVNFENNIIKSLSRTLISTCKGTVIKNNKYIECKMPIFLIDCPQYWYESGRICNVKIIENSFDDCCYDTGEKHSIIITRKFSDKIFKVCTNKNIIIHKNKVKNSMLALSEYIDGLSITENICEIENRKIENITSEIPIRLTCCKNVTIENNKTLIR